MNDTSVQSWEINEKNKTKQNQANYYWKSPFPGRTLLLVCTQYTAADCWKGVGIILLALFCPCSYRGWKDFRIKKKSWDWIPERAQTASCIWPARHEDWCKTTPPSLRAQADARHPKSPNHLKPGAPKAAWKAEARARQRGALAWNKHCPSDPAQGFVAIMPTWSIYLLGPSPGGVIAHTANKKTLCSRGRERFWYC